MVNENISFSAELDHWTKTNERILPKSYQKQAIFESAVLRHLLDRESDFLWKLRKIGAEEVARFIQEKKPWINGIKPMIQRGVIQVFDDKNEQINLSLFVNKRLSPSYRAVLTPSPELHKLLSELDVIANSCPEQYLLRVFDEFGPAIARAAVERSRADALLKRNRAASRKKPETDSQGVSSESVGLITLILCAAKMSAAASAELAQYCARLPQDVLIEHFRPPVDSQKELMRIWQIRNFK